MHIDTARLVLEWSSITFHSSSPYQLNFTLNGIKHQLEFIPPNEIRTLVGTSMSTANETNQIIALFQDNVAALTSTIKWLSMSPCDMLLG